MEGYIKSISDHCKSKAGIKAIHVQLVWEKRLCEWRSRASLKSTEGLATHRGREKDPWQRELLCFSVRWPWKQGVHKTDRKLATWPFEVFFRSAFVIFKVAGGMVSCNHSISVVQNERYFDLRSIWFDYSFLYLYALLWLVKKHEVEGSLLSKFDQFLKIFLWDRHIKRANLNNKAPWHLCQFCVLVFSLARIYRKNRYRGPWHQRCLLGEESKWVRIRLKTHAFYFSWGSHCQFIFL